MVGFDLPASMADYAGRVACTARGGRTGVVSTLIGENESKESLVQLMALLRATDSEAIIARRIADAHLQIAHCHEFDYLVVNEDLGAAHDQFQAVLVAELLRRARQGSLVRSFVRSAEGRAPIAR